MGLLLFAWMKNKNFSCVLAKKRVVNSYPFVII